MESTWNLWLRVKSSDGGEEGPRKGCNAGGKAGSIFKCTDLVQICACLPYRVVAQDGHSFKRTHHQDMSNFDHHHFSTNLNSAVPGCCIVVSLLVSSTTYKDRSLV